MGMFVDTDPSDNKGKPQGMTLDEFVNSAGSKEIIEFLATVRTATYSACHKAMPGRAATLVLAEEKSPQEL